MRASFTLALCLVLAACSAHAGVQRPIAGSHVTAAILDAGDVPDFHFEDVTVSAAGSAEFVNARTALASTNVVSALQVPQVRRVLLFLAGYNTSFAHGAAEASRIAARLDPGTVLLYADWGSKGKALAYARDGKSAARNAAAFGHLLEYLHKQLPSRDLDVFAHSMGSRVAIRGLSTTVLDHRAVPVRHLILAAPDVQIRDYVLAMHQIGSLQKATIYVSRRDKALLLSAVIHLHHRLGQVSVERLDLPRTDVVDVSAEDHSKDGHGYAVHDDRILRDISAVVLDAPEPHQAWCRSRRYAGVWIYVPFTTKRVYPLAC